MVIIVFSTIQQGYEICIELIVLSLIIIICRNRQQNGKK